MNTNRLVGMLILGLVLLGSLPSRGAEPAALAAGFHEPPLAARPSVYWAWINGLTDRDQRTRELEEFKAKGIGGVYIFDVGAQDPQKVVPAGPAFMGPESLQAIGHTVREATRLGLEVGLITSSSWNCGGPWIPPRYASMGLYHNQMTVKGPTRLSEPLPLPALPNAAPRDPDGRPVFLKEVAVLAVPNPKRAPGHEFVIELAPPGLHTLDRVVLYNTDSGDEKRYGPLHLYAKDFVVSVSTTTTDPDAFHPVVRAGLEPHANAQTFPFAAVPARYVKLVILSGHNTKFDRVQLAEFEVHATDATNVALAYHPDGSRTAASLVHCSSALGTETERNWTAANIHDGRKSGAIGSWSSPGPPPLIIEDPEAIVDLTGRVDAEGRLDWDVPAGEWTILRFVCANTGLPLRLPSPNSGGLAIDHFNAEATKFHFQYLLDKLRQELGDFRETALKQMYVCSYELSGSTWTPDFLAQFQRRRGYDLARFLPVLAGCVVQNPQVTARFHYDYRKTLGDLLVDAFYRTATELSNEHGLLLCAEAGGPGAPLHQVPVDALKAQGAIDIPRGEFWKDHNVWVVKETACASHIYGKGIVDMEAFTSWRHWQDGPFDLKSLADQAFCDGANHFTLHTCGHNPSATDRPGWVYHAGTHAGPSLAWWPKAKPWLDYLSRCSYLLQQGLFVGDVCYYYGDQGFNFVPPKQIDPALGYGYDYDVTNAEVLLTRMSVKDGRLVLPDGMSYELLVLPERDDIDLPVLQKIEQLVQAGATVVGPKPMRSNGLTGYPRRDTQVREMAQKLWGRCDGKEHKENPCGQGKIVWGASLREILQTRGLGPDFGFVSDDKDCDLDYIHRRAGDTDIYFVSNRREQWQEATCSFRVSGKVPRLWLPDTGAIKSCPSYEQAGSITRVPLQLAPFGSVFVVFQPAGRRAARVAGILPARVEGVSPSSRGPEALDTRGRDVRDTRAIAPGSGAAAREIDGPWQVRFPPGWGVPASKAFPQLISWTEDSDEGVKYFSGIAAYHKTLDLTAEQLKADQRLVLDLGRVRFLAEVYLNGRSLGIVWKPPFQVDITEAAKAGVNELVVEVANTWSNRLVGDARTEGRDFCRTNIIRSLTWTVPWKDTPLLESGLLGPVRLISVRE